MQGIVQAAGLVVVAYVAREVFDGAGIDVGGWVPPALAAAFAVLAAGVLPTLAWRRWRYEIRDEAIDLRRGAIVVRRTVVPMRRVQHVDTSSGPLQAAFELATVTFHTAAGPVSIPALGRQEAATVRRRVSELAQTLDDV